MTLCTAEYEDAFVCRFHDDNGTMDGYCLYKERLCHPCECNKDICNIPRSCENCTGCISGSGYRDY